MRYAFIGLGHLGAPHAASLAKAGFAVAVFDRVRTPGATGNNANNANTPGQTLFTAPTQNTSLTFAGTAQNTANRVFTDRMAVTVVDVMPNGNLVVEGYRSRVVEGEERLLRITGIVRPADIQVGNVIPSGSGFLALLGVATASAVIANLINNLPANLLILPIVAAGGVGPALAVLIGVNIGPNLTYAGSLATLLWRRAVGEVDGVPRLKDFTVLGLATVPVAVVAATAALWLALQAIGTG